MNINISAVKCYILLIDKVPPLSQVKVMAEDRAEWEGKVFISEPFSPLPPLATTSCIIEDRGNHTQHCITRISYLIRHEHYLQHTL